MKDKRPKNLIASVHYRLLEHARKTKDEPQLVLMRYGLERLMYRLSQSQYAGEFVVKGAMLFLVWTGEPHRATKDLDLLALETSSAEKLKKVFRELCELTVVEDALVFLPGSVKAAEIRENAVYEGVRVTIEARLGKARLPLQVDIGFGDVVTPKAEKAFFPPLLEFPAPRLSMYPKETVIAEKFEAMVKLGIVNSRMKDYYDIWALSREFEFDWAGLCDALVATFRRRKTPFPTDFPLALSEEFSGDATKQTQWRAFIKRGRLRVSEEDLGEVIAVIRGFLGPLFLPTAGAEPFKAHWPKGGPWKGK